MKKYTCYILFIFVATICRAQNQVQIPVRMDGDKVLLPNEIANSNIALPFSLVFDEAFFKNKKITFYSTPNETKKIEEAVFGNQGLKKKMLDNKPVYEIIIKENQTIDLNQSQKIIAGGRLFFKIGQSNFSPELKIKKAGDAKPVPPPANPTVNNDLHSGFIIDDALLLNQKKANRHLVSDSSFIRTILRSYGIDNNESLKANHFLNSELNGTFDQIFDTTDEGGSQSAGDLISSAFSSIGGLDVTNIADGLAKFIVKRAKMELSIAFFKKFKDDLKRYPDLNTVFPATYIQLEAIDQEIYNFSNYVEKLREAFRSDLKNIDEYLPGIIDNHKDFFEMPGNFELALALRTGCHITNALKHDMHPGDILDSYPSSFLDNSPIEDKPKLDVFKGSIEALQLLSESLKEGDPSKQSYWAGIDKIRKVVNDKGAFKIYLGLMLQVAHLKYEGVKFSETINFYDQLNQPNNVAAFDNSLDIYASYKQYILDFGSKVNEISRMIKEHEKSTVDSIKVEQYAKYLKASVQLMEYCVRVTKLPVMRDVPALKDLDRITSKYFDIANETTYLAIAINRKNYSEVGNRVILIYNKIALTPPADENVNKVIVALAKYGAFMSNIINARNSDEVSAAIEAVALPVGSAKIKRETPFNVSLNAYGGFFYGHEFIPGIKDKLAFNTYGVTAPVGVSISRGHSIFFIGTGEKGWSDNTGGWSTSLFISLIDVGAVAAYRVGNDSIAQVPTIQLRDIFSPGALISLGIPKTPLALNFGVQFGPSLRKVNGAKNDYSDKTYVRLSASLCVDIPILNFYTRSKN